MGKRRSLRVETKCRVAVSGQGTERKVAGERSSGGIRSVAHKAIQAVSLADHSISRRTGRKSGSATIPFHASDACVRRVSLLNPFQFGRCTAGAARAVGFLGNISMSGRGQSPCRAAAGEPGSRILSYLIEVDRGWAPLSGLTAIEFALPGGARAERTFREV